MYYLYGIQYKLLLHTIWILCRIFCRTFKAQKQYCFQSSQSTKKLKQKVYSNCFYFWCRILQFIELLVYSHQVNSIARMGWRAVCPKSQVHPGCQICHSGHNPKHFRPVQHTHFLVPVVGWRGLHRLQQHQSLSRSGTEKPLVPFCNIPRPVQMTYAGLTGFGLHSEWPVSLWPLLKILR